MYKILGSLVINYKNKAKIIKKLLISYFDGLITREITLPHMRDHTTVKHRNKAAFLHRNKAAFFENR